MQETGRPRIYFCKLELSFAIDLTNPIITRSSKILTIPYVPQQGNACWAAAGAAFGQYYTGDTYSHYSASDLAGIMEIGIDDGGTIEDTRQMLSRVFGVNTTYHRGYLSHNEAIGLINQAKPILAVFYGTYNNTTPADEVGHMVVLCGYDDGWGATPIKYYVRDSNSESMMITQSYSGDQLMLDYYQGITMYWVEAAY